MELLSEALTDLVFGNECKSCPRPTGSLDRYTSIFKRLSEECIEGAQRLPKVHGERILNDSIIRVANTNEWDHCMSILGDCKVRC